MAPNRMHIETSGLESKATEDVSNYVHQFINERFSGADGKCSLPDDIKMIVAEIVFDAFHDGMTFCEEQHVSRKRETKIITPGSDQ